MRSRWTRFLPAFSSGTWTNSIGSASGVGRGPLTVATYSDAPGPTFQPSACAQNRASRPASRASYVTSPIRKVLMDGMMTGGSDKSPYGVRGGADAEQRNHRRGVPR